MEEIFSGKLPPEIFNLTSLKSLDIIRNNFSGQFPKGIPKLKNLVVLDAFSNSFTGQLPAEFSELVFLKILNLAGSYFSGTIPSEYGYFRSLEFLHLAGNSYLEVCLKNLVTSKQRHISKLITTFIRVSFPPQLGNLSRLHYLDIAGANLSGLSLQSLFLFRNQLTGSIPSEFSNIKPHKFRSF
jgi:Leucine-rich repeat (LRR) protein